MDDLVFERAAEVVPAVGVSRATFFANIQRGLWTKPVALGPNSSAWPKHERMTLMSARMAGKSDDEIRELVKRLHAQRVELFQVLAEAV